MKKLILALSLTLVANVNIAAADMPGAQLKSNTETLVKELVKAQHLSSSAQIQVIEDLDNKANSLFEQYQSNKIPAKDQVAILDCMQFIARQKEAFYSNPSSAESADPDMNFVEVSVNS